METCLNVIIILGMVLVAVGALVAWYGVRTHRALGARYALAATNWARTSATVCDAQLIDHEDSNSEGYDVQWFEPRIRYSYAVDGASYEGQQTALGQPLRFDVLASAQKWLLAHAPGSTIDLWYNPANPSDSSPTLDAPSRASATTTIGIGAALAVFGLTVALHLF